MKKNKNNKTNMIKDQYLVLVFFIIIKRKKAYFVGKLKKFEAIKMEGKK